MGKKPQNKPKPQQSLLKLFQVKHLDNSSQSLGRETEAVFLRLNTELAANVAGLFPPFFKNYKSRAQTCAKAESSAPRMFPPLKLAACLLRRAAWRTPAVPRLCRRCRGGIIKQISHQLIMVSAAAIWSCASCHEERRGRRGVCEGVFNCERRGGGA